MSAKLSFTIGDKKGVFTIIGKADESHGHAVVCLCECGKERIMKVNFFYSSLNKFPRCKCYYTETAQYQSHPIYGVWKSMRCRCTYKKSPRYKDYGGRGIRVCERWNNFLLFMEDILPKWKHGLQLDRIDNDGDYCPENVQLLPPVENCRKRPSSKLSMELADIIRGSHKSPKQLAHELNVSLAAIYHVKLGRRWAK